LGLSFDEQASAKTYEMKYGSRDDQVILWTILSPDEQIVTCAMEEYAKKKGRDASATDGVEGGGDATAAATGEGGGQCLKKFNPRVRVDILTVRKKFKKSRLIFLFPK
jgi:hypothetical protein